jgi:uncharacterized protein (TIGR03067 family)
MAKYETPETLGESLLRQMQGDWRVVYSEINGEMTPVADFSNIVTTHKGNTFTVKKNDKVIHEGRGSINAIAMPHGMALTYVNTQNEAFKGGPRVGIFALAGDTMKTAFAPIGHEAPKDFNSYPDSDIVISIYQRVGAEKGTGLAVSKSKAIAQW